MDEGGFRIMVAQLSAFLYIIDTKNLCFFGVKFSNFQRSTRKGRNFLICTKNRAFFTAQKVHFWDKLEYIDGETKRLSKNLKDLIKKS